MDISKNNSGLNIFQLKIAALIFMTMDHIYYFLKDIFPIPILFTIIGRLAAPIFIFAICSGYEHTHNRMAYIARLYGFSVLMGVLNLFMNSFIPHPFGAAAIGNIFATMFIIVYYITFIEMMINGVRSRSKINMFKAISGIIIPFVLQAVILVLSLYTYSKGLYSIQYIMSLSLSIFLPLPLTVEGSIFFVAFGVVLYYTRKNKGTLIVFYTAFSLIFLLSVVSSGFSVENLIEQNQWAMIFALPIILLYNGKKGRGMKYLFYVYYPLHIFILMFAATAIAL